MSYERLELINGVTKWDAEKVQHLEDAIIKNENDIQKYHNDTVVEMQADWDQEDETAKDYVKNRTHYKSSETLTIIENFETETYETMRGDEGYEVMMVTLTNSSIPSNFTISTEDQVNNLYVKINNELITSTVDQYYELESVQWNLSNGLRLKYWAGKGDGPDWYIYLPEYSQFPVGEHLTIDIYTKAITYTTLDEKYLPPSVFTQSDWNCSNEDDVAYVKNRTHYSYYQWNDDMESYGEFPRYYTIPVNDNVEGPGYWMGTEAFVLEGQYILTAQSDWQFINVNDDGFEVYTWEFFDEINDKLVKLEVQIMRDNNIYNTIWDYNHGYGQFEKAYEVIKTLDDKYIPNSVAKNLDWNEDSENSSSYIKNRTHYPYKGVVKTIYLGRMQFNGEYDEWTEVINLLPYEQIIESDLTLADAPGYWLGSMGGYWLGQGDFSGTADAYSNWQMVDTETTITSYRYSTEYYPSFSFEVDVEEIGFNKYRVILKSAYVYAGGDSEKRIGILGLNYKKLDDVYLPDTIARVTDLTNLDTKVTGDLEVLDTKLTDDLTNLDTKVEMLTWSDLGEKVTEDQVVFVYNSGFSELVHNGIEGTSLSVGDKCKVALSTHHIEEYVATVDESYSFDITISGYSVLLRITYNKNDNEYSITQPQDDPDAPKLEFAGLTITKLSGSQITEIDEKYIPDTIARAPKATFDDIEEAPTASDFNTLLSILREAGILATE